MVEWELRPVVDVATLIVLAATLAVVYWQSQLIRRTLQADTFVTIQERAERIPLSETLDVIDKWSYTDYDVFKKEVPPELQARVRAVVDFFNDLSHLARSNYVDDYYPIRLYHPSLITCKEKLLPWWIAGLRKERNNGFLYNNFAFLCDYAQYWKDSGFARTGYLKYLKSQGVVEL